MTPWLLGQRPALRLPARPNLPFLLLLFNLLDLSLTSEDDLRVGGTELVSTKNLAFMFLFLQVSCN